MRVFQILLMAAVLSVPVYAAFAEEAAAPASQGADYDRRLDLARKMHEISPARDQVNKAIDQVSQSQPTKDRDAFKTAMQNVLNYKAIEKISIDAMAEVYSEAELAAMVDYYAKPEAKSAAAKEQQYADKVYPEIVRMLDQAMMRVKTGGN